MCSSGDVDATPAIRRHVDVIGGGTGMSLRGKGYPVELDFSKVTEGNGEGNRKKTGCAEFS